MANNKMRTLINGEEQEGLGADGLPEETQVLKAAEKDDDSINFVVEGEEEVAKPAAKAESSDELADYKASKDDEYETLKKQLAEERAIRQRIQEEQEEAYRYAQQAQEENQRLQGILKQGTTLYTDTVKSKLDTELVAAQRSYKEAYESGDSEGMVEAQVKIAELIAEKREISRQAPLQLQETPVYNQPIQQTASSPSVPKADPKAEAWYERNKGWFGPDDEMTAIAYAVDKKLMREGIDPRTDEYYRRLDARLREVFPDRFPDAEPQSKPVRQQSTVVAPASRSASPKTVKIPPGGAAVARKLGIPLEEYAKQWAAVNGRSQ